MPVLLHFFALCASATIQTGSLRGPAYSSYGSESGHAVCSFVASPAILSDTSMGGKPSGFVKTMQINGVVSKGTSGESIQAQTKSIFAQVEQLMVTYELPYIASIDISLHDIHDWDVVHSMLNTFLEHLVETFDTTSSTTPALNVFQPKGRIPACGAVDNEEHDVEMSLVLVGDDKTPLYSFKTASNSTLATAPIVTSLTDGVAVHGVEETRVFISGMSANFSFADESTTYGAQVINAMQQVEAQLEVVGLDKSHVVAASVQMLAIPSPYTGLEDDDEEAFEREWAGLNKAWNDYFNGYVLPTQLAFGVYGIKASATSGLTQMRPQRGVQLSIIASSTKVDLGPDSGLQLTAPVKSMSPNIPDFLLPFSAAAGSEDTTGSGASNPVKPSSVWLSGILRGGASAGNSMRSQANWIFEKIETQLGELDMTLEHATAIEMCVHSPVNETETEFADSIAQLVDVYNSHLGQTRSPPTVTVVQAVHLGGGDPTRVEITTRASRSKVSLEDYSNRRRKRAVVGFFSFFVDLVSRLF